MKGFKKWWQYQLIMWELQNQLRIESESIEFYEDVMGFSDDTNFRNIKSRIGNLKSLWLSKNMIN